MNSDGGRGRGRGRGGRGGRFNRGRGRGRSRGRGRGRGRGGSYGNTSDSSINWNLLQGIDPNGSLSFDDNTWYNFPRKTKNEINKLRNLQRQQCSINSIMSTYAANDDNSTIATRDIFSIAVPNSQQQTPPLPPQPDQQQPQPPSQPPPQGSTRSNNAGAAFGQ